MCSTIVAHGCEAQNSRTTATPLHEHAHDHVNVHVDVHVIVDVVGFFVTTGYILPASAPSFACSEHCLNRSYFQTPLTQEFPVPIIHQ
jgi:hypothetical protein